MFWSKKYYLYHMLTCWMPDSAALMSVKRVLLRWCGVRVGRNVQVSSGVCFLGSGRIVLDDDVVLHRGVQIGGRGLITYVALVAGVPATVKKTYTKKIQE